LSITSVVSHIKNDYENAVKTAQFNGNNYANGAKAKEALIRSQRIINYVHDSIKEEVCKGKC